jgi:ribosomal protein S27E
MKNQELNSVKLMLFGQGVKELSDGNKYVIYYKCSKCEGTSIVYDYGKGKPVCEKCGVSVSDLRKDYREAVIEEL